MAVAGHVTTYDTNFATEVTNMSTSQRIIFVDLNWSERKAIAGHAKPHPGKYIFTS